MCQISSQSRLGNALAVRVVQGHTDAMKRAMAELLYGDLKPVSQKEEADNISQRVQTAVNGEKLKTASANNGSRATSFKGFRGNQDVCPVTEPKSTQNSRWHHNRVCSGGNRVSFKSFVVTLAWRDGVDAREITYGHKFHNHST